MLLVCASQLISNNHLHSYYRQNLYKILQMQPHVRSAPKNLANFTGKQLCWSLFLIKLQG